ncbi:MAG: sulfoxide reductase heme-binding subunit YedZ [Halieaceae bacterium]|nr:sulfoxide reductase heme-binding subunit YedZ [Halieaceae bacterium]
MPPDAARATGSERWVTPTVIILCLLPLGLMIYELVSGQLGPDPAKRLMQRTGEWGLRGLLLVLLATPLAQRGYRGLFRFRRMLGLSLFLYTCLHLLLFAQVYVGWSGELLLEELKERPYVMVGFAAWCVLMPLAATSTDRARRWLGRRWRQLHRLIYPAAILAWLHVLWLVRSDVGEALIYGALFAVLLGWRLRRYLMSAR